MGGDSSMKKYSLGMIPYDQNGKRIKKKVSINLKRKLRKTIKTQAPGTIKLKRGRYRLYANRVLIDGVPYKCKKKIKIRMNKNRSVWIPYKRMPMIASPVPEQFDAMFNAINKKRLDNGAQPLKYQSRLAVVAQAHADDISAHNSASHFSSDGRTFEQRVDQSSYQGDPAGEIIANGTVGVDGAINAWVRSPKHFEAMINTDFDHVGIGFVNKYFEGYVHPTSWWVVDFGFDPVL